MVSSNFSQQLPEFAEKDQALLIVMLAKKFEKTRLPLGELNRNSSGIIGFAARPSARTSPAAHMAAAMKAAIMRG